MNGEIMEVTSYFKYLGSYFIDERRPEEDVQKRAVEGHETFVAINMMLLIGM